LARIDKPYRVWLAALFALLWLPLFAGLAGIGWELSQIAGLVSVVLCLLLAGASVRPRQAVPPTLLSLKAHRLLGWAAALAALLHLGGLVLADHRVLEYLKPSMPVYAWAGLLATAWLLALAFTAEPVLRRALWRTNRGFQVTHVIASCGLLVLLAMHVVTTHRYLGGRGRIAGFVVLATATVLMLLRARRGAAPATTGSWAKRLVFGDQSMRVVASLVVLIAALLAMSGDSARAALREPLIHRTATMPLDFPHEKHGQVNCLQCHHNYADGTGLDWCIHCHRSARSDLKEGAEARFHEFCLQCHRHPPAGVRGHGPVSGCSTCHRPPESARPTRPVSIPGVMH
jgi:hypothetical protein